MSPRRLTVQIQDVGEPVGYFPPSPPRPDTDAHDVAGFTPCRVCGGAVGTNGDYYGPWRQHADCGLLAAWPAQRLVVAAAVHGFDLTHTDALLLGHPVALYSDQHPEPTWDRSRRSRKSAAPSKPWGHVRRRDLSNAIAQVPAKRRTAGLDPSTCAEGPCAWCGAVSARGWTAYGHQWSNGSPAPLCGPCGAVYERYGSPSVFDWDAQRAGIAEAMTGVPTSQGHTPPAGLRGYAETASGDHGHADEPPWTHLPTEAVDAYRWAQWATYSGDYAPPEHRAEALARAAARRAELAQHADARRAELVARADTYGFSGVRDDEGDNTR